MYAVIKTGGQQYRVKAGQTLQVEKLELQPGEEVTFDDIMLLSDGESIEIGKPFVAGAKVVATVVKHKRGAKIKVLKFKRRKQYLKTQGHRQWYTTLEIKDVAKA